MKTITIVFNPKSCAEGEPYELFDRIRNTLDDANIASHLQERDATPEEAKAAKNAGVQ